MHNVLFSIMIVSINMFFSINAIIGVKYEGNESGNTYLIYLLFIFLSSIFLLFKYKFINRNIRIKDLIAFFFLTSIIISSFAMNTSLAKGLVYKQLLFIFLIVPVIIAGEYYSRNSGEIKKIIKIFEGIMLVFSIAILSAVVMPFIFGEKFITFGGETYQTASYVSAFSFGLNYYYLFSCKNIERLSFTKLKIYKFLQYVLLLIQFLSVFISGGRGGMVLIVAYFFFFLLQNKININRSKLRSSFIFIITIVTAYFFIYKRYLYNNLIFVNGLNRVFSFITVNGVNWEGTSGRGEVYTSIIDEISQSPILGNGFFNYTTLPHNIFLEVILATGILGVSVFIILGFTFFVKLYRLLKNMEGYHFFVVILIYPLIMLNFSGSFFNTTLLWFVISFVFYSKIPKIGNGYSDYETQYKSV